MPICLCDIEYQARPTHGEGMKHIAPPRAFKGAPVLAKASAMVLAATMVFSLSANAASAACYADYKAKKGYPMQLHYGVMEISGGCSVGAARGEISSRLSSKGWTLLNVLSVFDASGLAKRKQSAGNYYLRF